MDDIYGDYKKVLDVNSEFIQNAIKEAKDKLSKSLENYLFEIEVEKLEQKGYRSIDDDWEISKK
jgi:hypothetical protein